MKKRILIIGLSTFMLFASLAFIGCNPDYNAQEYGYFLISPCRGYRTTASILGFSELGRKQRIIAIPNTVNGRRVTDLGQGIGLSYFRQGSRFRSDSLSKLYVPRGVRIEQSFWNTLLPLDELVCLYANTNIVNSWGVTHTIISPHANGENVFRSNIKYMFNYNDSPNRDYFWFDLITGDNLYILPSPPH